MGEGLGQGMSRRVFISGAAALGGAFALARATDGEPAREQGVVPARAIPPTAPQTPPSQPVVEAYIRVNQVGFLPNDTKRAVIPAMGPIAGNAFSLIDDDVTPNVRFHAPLTLFQNPNGGRHGHFTHIFLADFDAFHTAGRYRLRLSDGRLSDPFSIGRKVYDQLGALTFRYFDVQRCGEQASALRGPCHLDDGVAVGGPRSGKPVTATGGWHDAGDYMKFVETTSYVTALMLFAHDHFPDAYPRADRHAPLPPLLAYAKIGLDWLLAMHPSPNEFYYQVGDAEDHETWRLPETDNSTANPKWKPRQVLFGVGANLAGRTAAAFAMAARLYRRHDAAFADRCLASARTAYHLGFTNRRALSTDPADFYPETTWADDMEWGAAALYEATGQAEFREQALAFAHDAGSAHDATSVYNTHALAHFTLYPHAPADDKKLLRDYLRHDADLAVERASQNPYSLATPYVWGTAEAAVGAALACLLYSRAAGDDGENNYAVIARRQRDFILGCNPFGLSCVVGAGTRYPLFPHHPVANIRSAELTGALVGGPADAKTFKDQHISLRGTEFDTQTAGPTLTADVPDYVGVYHDAVQDYVTNEPANDYTAKFLLLTAFYHSAGGARKRRA